MDKQDKDKDDVRKLREELAETKRQLEVAKKKRGFFWWLLGK